MEKHADKIPAITNRDIVAAEAHYHNSCYGNYARKIEKHQETRMPSKDEDESEIAYNKVESEAYSDLLAFIRHEMLPDKLIVPVATFAARMKNFMLSKGFRINDCQEAHQTETGIRSW